MLATQSKFPFSSARLRAWILLSCNTIGVASKNIILLFCILNALIKLIYGSYLAKGNYLSIW